MDAVPAVLEVPDALKLIEVLNVVGNIVPLKRICAPFRKLLPVTDTVKFPTGIGAGRTAFSTGELFERARTINGDTA